jgi:GntR family transcriptional repressor for pyruvate dehydrogenase complex
MESTQIRTESSSQAVEEVLRRWVALGVYRPGDRLPTERELAERLGVGRTSIRAALHALAEEGLITTTRGRAGGTVVLDDAGRLASSLRVTEELIDDVRDNFDFRLAVEPLAARLAARADDTRRWAIRGLAEGHTTSIRSFRSLDSRFHLAIAEASGNALVLEAVSTSRTQFFLWADAAWARLDWNTLSPAERNFGSQHRPVAIAIVDGDGPRAAEEMERHLRRGREQFVEVMRLEVEDRGNAVRVGSAR